MSINPNSLGPVIRPAKSSRNPPYSRILCFHNIDLNMNILSLGYQNHVIQELKIIYTSMYITFMGMLGQIKLF